MIKKSLIFIVMVFFFFGFICEGFSESLTDFELEKLKKEELNDKSDSKPLTDIEDFANILKGMLEKENRADSINRAGSDTWYSKDPKDLEPLRGTSWKFTYTIIINFTDTITFGTDIQTDSEGNVMLICKNQLDKVGGVLYTEFPTEIGGGKGFGAIIFGSTLNESYIFRINGDSAEGFYISQSLSTGTINTPRTMTGKCVENCSSSPNAGDWVDISGTIQNNDGIPLCSLVLANGQNMFSCGESQGKYKLKVPLDEKGEITLFSFCEGLQPFKKIIKPSEAVNLSIVMSPCP